MVTGGASGIGRAVALLFGRSGGSVALVDLDQYAGEDTLRELTAKGGNHIFICADVSQASEVERAVQITAQALHRIDVIFNNAGILKPEDPSEELPEEIWDQIWETNTKAAYLISRFAVPQMKKQGGGVIINNASITALRGSPQYPVYASSKAALIGLTRSLALQLARFNIRVICICPGSVFGTRLLVHARGHPPGPQDYLHLAKGIPTGRPAQPEDIAYLVLFLASEEAKHITATELIIDGGEMWR